jgi:hypothetical protein
VRKFQLHGLHANELCFVVGKGKQCCGHVIFAEAEPEPEPECIPDDNFLSNNATSNIKKDEWMRSSECG